MKKKTIVKFTNTETKLLFDFRVAFHGHDYDKCNKLTAKIKRILKFDDIQVARFVENSRLMRLIDQRGNTRTVTLSVMKDMKKKSFTERYAEELAESVEVR